MAVAIARLGHEVADGSTSAGQSDAGLDAEFGVHGVGKGKRNYPEKITTTLHEANLCGGGGYHFEQEVKEDAEAKAKAEADTEAEDKVVKEQQQLWQHLAQAKARFEAGAAEEEEY